LRDRNDEIAELGGRIVAIGTGGHAEAGAFVRDERLPFVVLVDDDAKAAEAAAITTLGWFQLLHPRTWRATLATSRRGYHVHKPGARVRQIGATFIIGTDGRLRYEHLDIDSTDHAPLDEVVAVLRADPT
jgi:peroxiredoxin